MSESLSLKKDVTVAIQLTSQELIQNIKFFGMTLGSFTLSLTGEDEYTLTYKASGPVSRKLKDNLFTG
jgi:hypothetical protein